MDFRERRIDFQEADRRYAELKRQLDAGIITDEEFDTQRQQLMLKDDEGRWWAQSRRTGEWHYHNGSVWVRGTPASYQPPRTPPAESTPGRWSQLEQGERLPSSQTSLVGSASIQDQDKWKQRRGAPRWVVIAVIGLMAMALLAGIGIIATMGGEGFEAAPGYSLFKYDTDALSVEVPIEWDERIFVDSEGEKGRSSWSSFLGEDGSAGVSMTAVNERDSWRTGTRGHQGIYMVASKELAQEYTDDELVTLGPNDYSSSCEAGTPQDFERPPYSGKVMSWSNCGGDSDHLAITLAAAPEDRECVLVAQIGGYFQTEIDDENIQHVLDTLEVDCSKIA